MYCVARRRQRVVEQTYKVYVCDTLQMIPQGMVPSRRYSDLLRPRQEIDADAIIDRVASAIGE